SNPRRIDVSASNVREAADLRQDLAEGIWPLPGNGKGADRSAAHAANGAQLGVVGEFHAKLLRHERQKLVDEKFRIRVAERVVFEAAVAAVVRARGGRIGRSAVAGIDE